MKPRIFAILSLLAYLVVIGHEMIPHHHHDIFMAEKSSLNNATHNHAHHGNAGHHHHPKENDLHQANHSDSHEKSNPEFPSHQHLVTTDDFECLRLATADNSWVQATLEFAQPFMDPLRLCSKPPVIDVRRFTDIPFQIPHNLEPESNGLRAPPPCA